MRNFRKCLFASLCAAASTAIFAAPTIDGAIDPGTEGWVSVGTNTLHSFDAGHKSAHQMYFFADPTNIYIAVRCNTSRYDAIALYVDFDTVSGTNNGSKGVVPAGTGGLGDLATDVLPMSDLDLVLLFNSGDNSSNGGDPNDPNCYLDWEDCRNGATFQQFIGQDAVTAGSTDASSVVGPANGVNGHAPVLPDDSVLFAYSDGNTSGNLTGTDGFEIRFPRAAIGAGSATTADFFLNLRGGGGFMANDTIPQMNAAGVTGGSSPHIGNSRPINFATGTSNNGGTWTSGGSTGPQLLSAAAVVTDWAVIE